MSDMIFWMNFWEKLGNTWQKYRGAGKERLRSRQRQVQSLLEDDDHLRSFGEPEPEASEVEPVLVTVTVTTVKIVRLPITQPVRPLLRSGSDAFEAFLPSSTAESASGITYTGANVFFSVPATKHFGAPTLSSPLVATTTNFHDLAVLKSVLAAEVFICTVMGLFLLLPFFRFVAFTVESEATAEDEESRPDQMLLDRISELEAEKAVLDACVAKVDGEKAVVEAKLDLYTASKQSLQEVVGTLQSDLTSTTSSKQSLQEQVVTLRSDLACTTASKQSLQEQVGTLQSDLTSASSSKQSLQEQVGALQTKLDSSATNSESVSKENADLKTEADEQAKRLEDMNAKFKGRGQELAYKGRQLTESKEKAERLEEDVKVKSLEYATLQKSFDGLQAENNALHEEFSTSKFSAQTAEVKNLTEQKDALATKLEQTKNSFLVEANEVVALNAAIGSLDDSLKAQESKAIEASSLAAAKDIEVKKLTESVDTLNKQLAETKQENSSLSKEYRNNLKIKADDVAEALKTASERYREINDVRKEKSKLEDQLEESEVKQGCLARDYQEVFETVNEMSELEEEARSELAIARKEVKDLQEYRQNADQEIKNLKTSMVAGKKLVEDAVAEKETVVKEKDGVIANKDEQIRSLQASDAQVQVLQKELQQLQNSKAESQQLQAKLHQQHAAAIQAKDDDIARKDELVSTLQAGLSNPSAKSIEEKLPASLLEDYTCPIPEGASPEEIEAVQDKRIAARYEVMAFQDNKILTKEDKVVSLDARIEDGSKTLSKTKTEVKEMNEVKHLAGHKKAVRKQIQNIEQVKDLLNGEAPAMPQAQLVLTIAKILVEVNVHMREKEEVKIEAPVEEEVPAAENIVDAPVVEEAVVAPVVVAAPETVEAPIVQEAVAAPIIEEAVAAPAVVAAPVATPVATPTSAPVATPIVAPATPVAAPAAPTVAPVAAPAPAAPAKNDAGQSLKSQWVGDAPAAAPTVSTIKSKWANNTPTARASKIDSSYPTSKPAPKGPRWSQQALPRERVPPSGPQPTAVTGWSNFPSKARAEDRAENEKLAREAAAKQEEIRAGVPQDPAYTFNETWNQVQAGDQATRLISRGPQSSASASNVSGAVSSLPTTSMDVGPRDVNEPRKSTPIVKLPPASPAPAAKTPWNIPGEISLAMSKFSNPPPSRLATPALLTAVTPTAPEFQYRGPPPYLSPGNSYGEKLERDEQGRPMVYNVDGVRLKYNTTNQLIQIEPKSSDTSQRGGNGNNGGNRGNYGNNRRGGKPSGFKGGKAEYDY